MKKTILLACAITIAVVGCNKDEEVPALEFTVNEDLATYKEIASIGLGGVGAAEITTYDAQTKRLFAVNNGTTNKIDVIDLADPSSIKVIHSISMTPYGGYVNSVSAYNGKVAAAIESTDKQAAGKIVVFNASTYAEEKVITVGALPDMVTYSPDGKYILSANEGEPNTSYTNDPEGSVSIIDVANNYAVKTVNFSAFSNQLADLTSKGLRVFGPGKDFVKDIEPEYITVSDDSKTAWVTLQENNAIAEINITAGTITKISPLGFKDYNAAGNMIDISDKDNAVGVFAPWKVFGTYMPDAIASTKYNGVTYLFTANEGDAREYDAFAEVKRIKDLKLDEAAFPNASALKAEPQMGRLNVTTTLGDKDGDGDYDALYSFGARSFSVWNAQTGQQVYDSKNELDVKIKEANLYDDARSDDKSIEPEAIAIGRVGSKLVAYVGMERVDAVAVYDITNPTAPVFVKTIPTGDAPEGVLFIPAPKSPIQQSLIVVSSENDGVVKVYKANKL
ncbi:choice-of-anchor I family protein [Emticicia sp. C21]|uniref:choice-of-anchor I family protein n=1 Tax=Emticicia sp. C21 TaxID=2302915 RepID=UPI000E354590|nr:choice-of-anchor I family protein [Emticicia sp. C21]RFS15766.1 alkaline phosphatase [Emticicia sp. C21]